jgi:uncharacterized Ntn-hydrolase superfamily protein
VRPLVALAVLAALVPAPRLARATYSIVAADPVSGAVGGAVASCVPLSTVERVYGAAPGVGALVTQSYLMDEARADGLAWLAAGRSPDEVVAALTDAAYDPHFALRQYAVVDLAGRAAGFTGAEALAFAGGLPIESGDLRASVQGNILTGPQVLERARDAFVAPGACDLAERLMRALEAAGAEGGGDSRCVGVGVPAKSATLEVDPASGPATLRLAYEAAGDPPREDPVAGLRAALDAWRVDHPCPTPASPASAPGASTSGEVEATGCAAGGAPRREGCVALAIGAGWAAVGCSRARRRSSGQSGKHG